MSFDRRPIILKSSDDDSSKLQSSVINSGCLSGRIPALTTRLFLIYKNINPMLHTLDKISSRTDWLLHIIT